MIIEPFDYDNALISEKDAKLFKEKIKKNNRKLEDISNLVLEEVSHLPISQYIGNFFKDKVYDFDDPNLPLTNCVVINSYLKVFEYFDIDTKFFYNQYIKVKEKDTIKKFYLTKSYVGSNKNFLPYDVERIVVIIGEHFFSSPYYLNKYKKQIDFLRYTNNASMMLESLNMKKIVDVTNSYFLSFHEAFKYFTSEEKVNDLGNFFKVGISKFKSERLDSLSKADLNEFKKVYAFDINSIDKKKEYSLNVLTIKEEYTKEFPKLAGVHIDGDHTYGLIYYVKNILSYNKKEMINKLKRPIPFGIIEELQNPGHIDTYVTFNYKFKIKNNTVFRIDRVSKTEENIGTLLPDNTFIYDNTTFGAKSHIFNYVYIEKVTTKNILSQQKLASELMPSMIIEMEKNEERYSNMVSEMNEIITRQVELIEKKNVELKKLNQQKTTFFINLAHEIKTPLTIINNYFDKYLKKVELDDDLKIIKNNMSKLKRDLVNYLDIEKIEQGKMFYNNDQIINISELLIEKIILFKETAVINGINLDSVIDENIYMKADPYAIDRIANNLLDNAIKYNKPEGSISVELKCDKDKIKFVVKDAGSGISEAQKEKIFLPFHQISYAKSNIQGIGMGLNIVHRIINSLNGKIEIESKIDEGTKFIITFNKYKVSKDEEIIETTVSTPIYNVSATRNLKDSEFLQSRKTILLVEDNLDMLSYLSNELSKLYNVYLSENGKEALNKLKRISKPDIIISDIMMDKMDGYQLYEHTSKEEDKKDIAFVFLTAKVSEQDKNKRLTEGAVDYISKPFSIEELQAKIVSILKNKDKQKESGLREAMGVISRQIINPDKTLDDELKNFKEKAKKYQLTDRQEEIVILIKEGFEYKEIAEKLDIALKTVDKHIQNLYEKTNAHNKIDIINLFS